ncbi:Secretory carrier-associated membrane protein 4 (Secretory carrier membrane protein 4) [Durusdinium trenchii]|uniref:Secretory carrier-associated membrane protein 4 (Secretory carrier membrane protein 4) n=1 Tax=Durusdinium trenchii TaxID=1381693 RepID=A0ABP0J1U4_9DINO
MGNRHARPPAKARPSRHAWQRIQDVNYREEDEYDSSDDEDNWDFDRRVVDERADWPRSCPVLHLNIQEDFPLEAQRKLVRSLYRFWQFSWWVSVMNFVAVMATLLTSNVTNSSAMVTAFVVSLVYLFAVFFLYFRVLYWALRLESNVLFVWFYVFSVVMFAYFAYYIAEGVSLVSILAEPLAPGSQLPVKINPIFPVVMFTLVIVFYVFCIMLVFYYFSSAFYWQRLSDKDKLQLYKKQNKRKWLSSWFGGKVGDDILDDADEDEDGKPAFSWPCILQYEQVDDDHLNDVELPSAKSGDKKNKKKKKKKKKANNMQTPYTPRPNAGDHQTLSIPGKVSLYPQDRKVVFRAEEAIFNNVFKVSVMFVNVQMMKKQGETELDLVETFTDHVMDEDRKGFQTVTATCGNKESTLRILKFDFETKQEREECHKKMSKTWKVIKKKEQLYHATDEENLKELRLRMHARARERSAQHLLTHKDWKLMVSLVWRHVYQAGSVIQTKDSHFKEILHISKGTAAIYLETSDGAQTSMASTVMDEDFDLQAALFPILGNEKAMADRDPTARTDITTESQLNQVPKTSPHYYTVRFEKRKLGFSYLKMRRKYNLVEYEPTHFMEATHRGSSGIGDNKKSFREFAAIVQNVKDGGEAARLMVHAGDELVKVGLFNIEEAELSQPAITRLIKSESYPLTMTFRRPPELDFEVDEGGFIDPDPNLVPPELRGLMMEEDQEAENEPLVPRVVLDGGSGRSENSHSLLHDSTPFARVGDEYQTSDEDTGDEGGDAFEDKEVDLLSFHEVKEGAGAAVVPSEVPQEDGPGVPRKDARVPASPGSHGSGRRGRRSHRASLGGTSYASSNAQPRLAFEMSRLELAEELASRPPGVGASQHGEAEADDMYVEFEALEPTAPPFSESRRLSDLNAYAEAQMMRGGRRVSYDEAAGEVAVKPSSNSFLARGRAFLFGNSFEYDKVEEERLREAYSLQMSQDRPFSEHGDGSSDAGDDEISIIVDRNFSDDDSEDDLGLDYFGTIPTFEPVGHFKKGDTIGIIPWILNHPVSVVQLVAQTDVVVHSIKVEDLTKLFRKHGTLALSFFKYVAAVIGERADRDEEELCDQITEDLAKRDTKVYTNKQLTRLLDNKPIRSTQVTEFERRAEESDKARGWFQQDFDMAYDSVIFHIGCEAQIVGDISILVGQSWYGVDTSSSGKYNENKVGTLYITHYHVCFRSSKRALDLAKLKRRPTLYGKLHLDDIYDILRAGENGERLSIVTDEVRLDVNFASRQKAQYVEDWLRCLIDSGAVTERAPHSYTLPGDMYGFSSDKPAAKEMPESVQEDPLNVLYTKQRDLRLEFLILTQTLQQVLTKQDRYKMFHDGRSVTLRRGQNVLSAARAANGHPDKNDEGGSRRPQTSKRALESDGPNGLYLVGHGELVLQREVNGRRIRFASYKVGTVFGVERFLTGAPSPFSVKVVSKTAMLKFAPRDRCMALLRSDLALAARFYQYCALLQMQRLRGPVLSRPTDEDEAESVVQSRGGSRGCTIL